MVLKQISSIMKFRILVTVIGAYLAMKTPYWWVVDAGSDDLLFIRQAESLIKLNWLGNFENGANLKVPGFAFVLVVFYLFHIPFHFGVWLINLAAGELLRRKLGTLGTDEKISTLIFCGFILNPSIFGPGNARILRDTMYGSLIILLIVIAFSTYYGRKTPPKKVNLIGLALLSSLLLLFREESIYVYGVIGSVIVFVACFYKGTSRILVISITGFLLITSSYISEFTVQQINNKVYGINSSAMLKDGPIIDLMKQMSRIKPIPKNPMLWISIEQRKIAYEKSPTLNKHSEGIEGDLNFYQEPSCSSSKLCDQVAGNYLPWAIFYGVTNDEKLYDSRLFLLELQKATRELESFCNQNSQCEKDSEGFGPLVTGFSLNELMSNSFQVAKNVLTLSSVHAKIGESGGSSGNSIQFRNVLKFQEPPLEFDSAQKPQPRSYAFFAIITYLGLLLIFCTRKLTLPIKVQPFIVLTLLAAVMLTGRMLILAVQQTIIGNTLATNYQSSADLIAWVIFVVFSSIALLLVKRNIK